LAARPILSTQLLPFWKITPKTNAQAGIGFRECIRIDPEKHFAGINLNILQNCKYIKSFGIQKFLFTHWMPTFVGMTEGCG